MPCDPPRILFCFYPLHVHYNHGVALLSQLCRDRGITTRLEMLESRDRFRTVLAEYNPDWVCFSAVIERDYTASLPYLRLANNWGFLTMLGGVYPRRVGIPPDCPADLVCQGEGETLPDFLLHGDDRLFTEKLVWPNLDTLPLPDYALFQEIPFDRELPFLKDEGGRLKDEKGFSVILPYYTSRGCPWPCTFCEVRTQTGIVRYRRNVGEDLAHLARTYQPELFMIGDETLPYWDREWRASWGEFRYPFVAYLRGDTPTEAVEWLQDRGLIGCAFGVECGDEQYRNEFLRKELRDADLFRFVADLERLGIPFAPFYLQGLPGESFRQQTKTAQMVQRIGGHSVIFQYEPLF